MKAPKTIYRLWLPDTTNKTIKQAFETAKPNAGYASLSSSAETRSEMDWLLGIELTRYVSIKAGGFTRIGRCVCPIVQHIIEREKAIKEFVPKPYSAVSSKEKTNGEEIELTSKRTFEEGHEAEAQALADAFNKAGATVTDIKTERKTVNPGKLFSMSDLQSFACKADKTLSPADVLAATQALYEGGYVTYPRTNSSYLATNETVKVDAAIRGLAQNGITGLINKPKLKSIYDDSKIEAHSAITPTGKWPASLTGTQKTVFDCILNRFCAVFCEEACTVDRTTIVIHCNDEDFTLKGDVQVTPGWRKFEKPTSGDKLLPKLNKGDAVNINFKTVGKMTTPPKRYTVEALNNWMVAPMRGAEKANEEYSDEEWKEILSDATICTEATRADINDLLHEPATRDAILKAQTEHQRDAMPMMDCGWLNWFPLEGTEFAEKFNTVRSTGNGPYFLDIDMPIIDQSVNVQSYGGDVVRDLVSNRLGIDIYYVRHLD